MALKLKKTIVKKSGNKKGKPKKNMVWSEEEATKYAKVLTDCDNKDEMFLEYQKQQAEANRKHKLMMAQILMQASSNTQPPLNSYTPPQPVPFPLQPSGSFGSFQWNNSYTGDASSENQDGPFYHNL